MNPIELEIYRNLFFSIAEEMGTVLRRTAYSPNIKERRDYSCALFDSNGDLAAMGDHMPVHLGSMPLSVKAAVEALPLYPGDVVILNDPFSGGTHLPDITLVSPVFEAGAETLRPAFYVAARAHHSDVGGMTPGSMPLSRELFQEGLIIPPLKLYEEGNLNLSLLRLILHNVRTPLEREGDLAAQVGALRVGDRRLREMIERNGRQTLLEHVAGLQDYSERMVRRLITEIPDGGYEAEDFLDCGGSIDTSGQNPVRICLKILVQGDRMTLDFAGSERQIEGSLNAVRAITLSAVFYVIRCLAAKEIPSTAGLMRPVEVLAPGGSVVDATFPSAVAGGNVETSQRIVDVVLKALSAALPDRIPAASSGTMNNIALGGVNRDSKRPFSYYETIGGGMGASPDREGDSGVHTHMTNSLNTPIEALENQFPIRVREYRLRQGSGGRGVHRGGDGIVRSLEMLCDAQVTLLSERRRYAPFGLKGGRAGKKGMNTLSTGRGRRRKVPSKANLFLKPGEILTIETPGGGGWGTPERRVGMSSRSTAGAGGGESPGKDARESRRGRGSQRRSSRRGPSGRPGNRRPKDAAPGSTSKGRKDSPSRRRNHAPVRDEDMPPPLPGQGEARPSARSASRRDGRTEEARTSSKGKDSGKTDRSKT